MSARLPTPGGDDGKWGNILNDFLLASHKTDGTLRIADDFADAQSNISNLVTKIQEKADIADLAEVAISGDYTHLHNLPAIPNSSNFLAKASDLSDLNDANAARVNLGLGAGDKPTFSGLIVTSHKVLRPEDYGAVGDGTTDDSEAFQDMFDAADEHLIYLITGKTYLIPSTVTADPAKVRGIIGNNSQLVTNSDVSVLKIAGDLNSTSGTANPTFPNTIAVKPEMNFFIRDLRIYSNQETYVGVGIELDGTMAVRIDGCHLYDLSSGVKLSARNRNLIIANSHIYNCLNYGIWFSSGSDLHQANIIGNHVSYCLKPVFLDNAATYNLQMVGNDIEISNAAVSAESCIHISSGSIESFMLVGNTIEAHNANTQALIRVTGWSSTNYNRIVITGNSINNAAGDTISIATANRVVISNNVGASTAGTGYFINMGQSDSIEALNVSNNTIRNRNGGFLRMHGGSTRSATNVSIQGNVIQQCTAAPIAIISARLVHSQIIDNVVDMYSAAAALPAGSAMIAIHASVTDLSTVTIRGNTMRARSKVEHGIRLASSSYQNVTISDNNVWEQTGEAYNLPINDQVHAYSNTDSTGLSASANCVDMVTDQTIGGAKTFTSNITMIGTIAHTGTGVGFYGSIPVAQQTLSLGSGASVDDIIAVLQNLGLIKNS